MHTSKKLLIIAAILASSATYAEQTRDLNGRMVLVYSGTADESSMVRKANYIEARSTSQTHVIQRKFRMQRLHSQLSVF